VTVDVTVADHAVHSGAFGGPLLDSVAISSMLIASLFDDKGDVAVPGLGGSDHADVDWPEEELRAAAGMVDGTGTITIKHEIDGQVWYTSYLHMYEDGIYVKAGDTVTAGQMIAGVGNTGRSSGSHLHFEVRTKDDTADESTVEPWGWLKQHNAVELTTNCS